MNSALTPTAARPLRRLIALVGVLGIVVSVVACGGKSETQLTNDALNAGIAAHTAGNIEEAKKQYNECLKHDATNKICHYDLGLIAHTAGDATTAENEYRLSLSTDPNYTPAIFNLAVLRTSLGDNVEAIDLYRRYIALLAVDAGAHLNLGLILISTGDKANGEKEIATAIKLDPKISVPQSTPSAQPSAESTPSPQPTPESKRSAAPSPSAK
jgi:tetratricopeptide (TPR) repeat protein